MEATVSAGTVMCVGDIGMVVPFESDLVLHLESDDGLVLSGSTVVEWTDGSSSNNDLTALGDPQLLDGQTPAGLPAVVFDGDGDALLRDALTSSISGLPSGSQDRTMIFLAEYQGGPRSHAGALYGDGETNQAFGLATGKRDQSLTVFGNSPTYDSGVAPSGWLVQSAVLSGNNLTHYLNSSEIDSEVHAFDTDVQRIVIGQDINGTVEKPMRVAAVLVFDRALGDSERLEVEDYLAAKYITGSLDSPPVAVDDSATTTAGTPVLIDVTSNDSDSDGDPFSITSAGPASNGTVAIDDNGTPTDEADDRILYTPAPGYFGPDSFSYTVTGDDGSDTATVSVSILSADPTPPTASDDSATTDEDVPVLIDVMANDSDPDGDSFSITSVGTPSKGTAVIDDNGTPGNPADDRILYTPEPDTFGADSFSYTISGDDGSDVATVNVTVNDTPDTAPVASDDTATTERDTAVRIDVLSNDTDAESDPFSITAVGTPTNGTVEIDDNGTPGNPSDDQIRYTPGSGFQGTASFDYTITGDDGSDTATVTVDVTEASQGPLPLDGFTAETVLDVRDSQWDIEPDFQPISMAFLPDNRMLLLSKTGVIRIVDPESGANDLYMTVNADTNGERGLLDITLDPDFENNGYFYLYYTPTDPKRARIERFQHEENSGGLTSRGVLGDVDGAGMRSEYVIWQDTDGYIKCCHYGAGLDFGPDGKLWLTASDKFQSSTIGEGNGDDRILDLSSSTGKIIRVNPDKDNPIPDGSDGWAANPFIDGDGPNDDSIWAYGLRNPFRARWDLEYGFMYIGEVGGNQQDVAEEDLHVTSLSQAGAFYGWPFYEGTGNVFTSDGRSVYDPADFPTADSDIADAASGDFYSAPIWSLPHNGLTNSLTGGEVYRGDMYPTAWDGVYFYGNYTKDYIRYLILDDTGLNVLGDHPFLPSEISGSEPKDVVSINVGADGALYYARIASGLIERVVYNGDGVNLAPEIVSSEASPVTGDLPLVVNFTATVTDPEGDPLTYVLNFGDGSDPVTGAVGPSGVVTAQYTYTENNLYNLSFSVSDGSKTSLAPTIQIEAGEINFPPEIANETVDLGFAEPGTELTFTALASDPDGDPLTFTWNFGDGESVTGSVPTDGNITVTHTYTENENYSSQLFVSDGTNTVLSNPVTVVIGDAPEFPVGAGLVLLLESDIKIGVGAGTTVTSWLDGSGQGNNLAALGDPQLLENQTPTGLPAIVFDGDGDALIREAATNSINNLPSGSQDRTMFFVAQYDGGSRKHAGVLYGDSAENETFGLATGKRDQSLTVFANKPTFDSGVAAEGWVVQSVLLDNNTISHYQNGQLIDDGQNIFNTDVQKIVVGQDIGGSVEKPMSVGAVLIYDRALTEAERQQVEGFLEAKYILGTVSAPPVAADDTATTDQDLAVLIDVLSNDSDADGDAFAITSVSAPTNGTAVVNDGGTPSDPTDDRVLYTPASGFFGADEFTYTITGNDGSDTATVAVTVNSTVATPPVASDDTASTDENVAVSIDVLANDTDPDADSFSIVSVTTPANGTAAINDGGTPGDPTDDRIVYTPNADFFGADEFEYTVSGDDGTDTATVSVTVNETPDTVPVAADDAVTTPVDTAVLVDVTANDLDADGDPFSITSVGTPSNGTAVIDDAGTPGDMTDDRILYTPSAGFVGDDSFSYTIAGDDGSDSGTVTVSVGSTSGLVEAGLVAAFETDGQVSRIGDTVIGWIDNSGKGNDLEAGGDPTFVAGATPTGEAAIVFDGDGDFLDRNVLNSEEFNQLPSGSEDRTMFFVVNYTSKDRKSVGFVFGDSEPDQAFGLTADKRDQSLTLEGYSTSFDSEVGSGGWLVQSVVLEGNAFSHYKDGQLIDSGSHVFETDLQRLVIGQEIGGAQEKSMEVAAAFLYDTALSETDRLQMESFLQEKYIDDAFLFV
ncbi:MAG: Ig-like domain-containing protein [Pseudomonadota bacterium]